MQIWFMGGSNGATTLSTTQAVASNFWYVVAAADFNGGDGSVLVYDGPIAGWWGRDDLTAS